MVDQQPVKRGRGRPPKAKPPVETTPLPSEEAAPQSPPVDIYEKNQDIGLDIRNLSFRRQQWSMLSERDKQNLGMTEEEFLRADDFTGAGPNAYYTKLEDRVPTPIKTE